MNKLHGFFHIFKLHVPNFYSDYNRIWKTIKTYLGKIKFNESNNISYSY